MVIYHFVDKRNIMEKQKPWQLYLIAAVVIITLYNILPTIFWYTKPLKEPIDKAQAELVAEESIQRVDGLQDEAIAWLGSFNKLLGLSPKTIQINSGSPKLIDIVFTNEKEAEIFTRFLPTAGTMIPFVPAQLKLAAKQNSVDPLQVTVERSIGVKLDPAKKQEFFTFSDKLTKEGSIAPFWQGLVYDRVALIGEGIAGVSGQAQQVAALIDHPADGEYDDLALSLSKEIQSIAQTLGENSPIAKRYFASLTQIDREDKTGMINKLIARLEGLKTKISNDQQKAVKEENKIKEAGQAVDSERARTTALKAQEVRSLESTIALLKKNTALFAAGKTPLSETQVKKLLSDSQKTIDKKELTQTIDLAGYHPFIAKISIDWLDDQVFLEFYPDVHGLRTGEEKTESDALKRETISRLVFNSIARLSRLSDENILPGGDDFLVQLSTLSGSKSILALNLGEVAKLTATDTLSTLRQGWHPEHKDFSPESFPIREYHDYTKESATTKSLGLVVYAPAAYGEEPPQGFRSNSIYIIARGLDSIIQKWQSLSNSENGKSLVADMKSLQELLQRQGFIGYSGASYGLPAEYANDFIFELSNYYSDLLGATREDYIVKGNKQYAVLEFTDLEQRILARNKIEDRVQEDLVKWYEEYNAAQVDMNPISRYTVPKPTKNPYWENFKLSFGKYFRGDDRKVLKWGLDLSGGKTVRIGLRDQNGKAITAPDDLKQASNELYNRVNKMGVSERTIRVENTSILLDFPGSQAFSAAELIKASAMYFHLVNEKFAQGNRELWPTVNQFLQEVWNEAVVTNRKDAESVQEISWRHLGGDPNSAQGAFPRSESARVLYESGLRLADPQTDKKSSTFNDQLSLVTLMRGNDLTDWHGQTHPLAVVFNNYALEGSSLTNIQVGYDPSEGNILSFSVKSSYDTKKEGSSGSPRQDFYNWTSHYSQDNVAGTNKEAYGPNGWRMAVILNDRIISAPSLRAALSDSARISGHFTQREINQLAADLKAGSLSFTPRILSEQNVSPELGKAERTHGIVSALIAVLLVIISMCGIYHFGGFVASCAVVFNLLIMWGILQSIGAALTLPGIAGIVLTIAMAVDANVLVFERVREEFAISGRIATALQAGYRKAFSAIIDSNLTTLLVAFILIQFDSGPIKGFAIVIVIGILCSLFTSLFVTRFFFAGWVRNPEHKSLSMARLIPPTNFNFLGQVKLAAIITVVIMALGTYFLVAEKNTILGMDFTGGYSLTVDLAEKQNTDYLADTKEALLSAGAQQGEVQIRELSHPNQLRIQLGISMEESGHPFHGMAEELQGTDTMYAYQKNPRITWLVDALKTKDLKIQENDLVSLDKNWSVMSGQLSDSMRNNAILALTLALIGVMIYITIRFEFKYAVGAVVGLLHDVLITLGIAALFHKLGFPVQLDLQAVGAVMTIIGYSLNDTIIVFDRIREEVKLLRKMPFEEVINHALNVTLNRTMMTSGTTILVLLSLVLFGGSSIFSFSLIMTIGVIVGTFSSLYIASPVMLWVHRREEEHRAKLHDVKQS